MQKYICECGKEFENPQSFNGHKSHCKIHAAALNKLSTILAAENRRHENCKKAWAPKRVCIENNKKEKQAQELSDWTQAQHTCEVCGNIMTEKFGSGRFCSDACAHTHKHSDATKRRLSEPAKKHPVGFAAPTFIQTGNRKNHSKRELEILDMLRTNFPEDNWKPGFVTNQKYNDCFINPDAHSLKLKIVIEYDGIWHFKDINGQLAKKQKTDSAVCAWCKENGYRLIRIDEELSITDEQIVNAIYHSDTKLELFGSSRYDYLLA